MAYTQYGVDFYDEKKATIKEVVFDSETDRSTFVFSLFEKLDDNTVWPETAVGVTTWERKVLVEGIDYGRGHIKARFPGQRVPKGAYQWR